MTTATTNPLPNVPLPPGAALVDDWQDDTPQPYRIIHAPNRGVGGHDVIVWATAVQWADGSIDDGRIEAPWIGVDIHGDHGLSSTQARELAAVLIYAADEVDGWATR
jgi:hypothetical protein